MKDQISPLPERRAKSGGGGWAWLHSATSYAKLT